LCDADFQTPRLADGKWKNGRQLPAGSEAGIQDGLRVFVGQPSDHSAHRFSRPMCPLLPECHLKSRELEGYLVEAKTISESMKDGDYPSLYIRSVTLEHLYENKVIKTEKAPATCNKSLKMKLTGKKDVEMGGP
jgi:hypothetical protein